MNFPGNILGRISRLFEGDIDEILVFVLVFLFIFLTNNPEEKLSGDSKGLENGMPIILIAIFVIFFLSSSYENELLT